MLIEELLEDAVGKGASDIHISANLPPVFRIDGKLIRTNMEALTAENVETLVFPILNNEQRRKLDICCRIQNNQHTGSFFRNIRPSACC